MDSALLRSYIIAAAAKRGRLTAAWEGRGTGVRGVIAVCRLSERGVSTAWGASSLRGRASPLRGIGLLALVS